MSQPLFVGIPQASDLRRQLLSDAKNTIDILRGYEGYLELRHQKLETVVHLKKLVREITVLNRRLRSRMPKVEIPRPKKERVLKQGKRKIIVTKKITPVDMLEQQLSRIEERLKTLE